MAVYHPFDARQAGCAWAGDYLHAADGCPLIDPSWGCYVERSQRDTIGGMFMESEIMLSVIALGGGLTVALIDSPICCCTCASGKHAHEKGRPAPGHPRPPVENEYRLRTIIESPEPEV